jgi:hypothetical protein
MQKISSTSLEIVASFLPHRDLARLWRSASIFDRCPLHVHQKLNIGHAVLEAVPDLVVFLMGIMTSAHYCRTTNLHIETISLDVLFQIVNIPGFRNRHLRCDNIEHGFQRFELRDHFHMLQQVVPRLDEHSSYGLLYTTKSLLSKLLHPDDIVQQFVLPLWSSLLPSIPQTSMQGITFRQDTQHLATFVVTQTWPVSTPDIALRLKMACDKRANLLGSCILADCDSSSQASSFLNKHGMRAGHFLFKNQSQWYLIGPPYSFDTITRCEVDPEGICQPLYTHDYKVCAQPPVDLHFPCLFKHMARYQFKDAVLDSRGYIVATRPTFINCRTSTKCELQALFRSSLPSAEGSLILPELDAHWEVSVVVFPAEEGHCACGCPTGIHDSRSHIVCCIKFKKETVFMSSTQYVENTPLVSDLLCQITAARVTAFYASF